MRDLFAGYRLELQPVGKKWVVRLASDEQSLTIDTVDSIPEAMEIVRECGPQMVDETEVTATPEQAAAARARLLEMFHREEAGEPWEPRLDLEWGAWFKRLMREGEG